MINIATIGTSFITEYFLEACRAVGRYRLLACYSRREDTAASFSKKHGFEKAYTDLEAMASDPEIQAVYIASPNVFHYRQSKLFLHHGKHVICEKPIATCADEYTELLSLANSKGLIYMEAIMSRYSLGRPILKEALGQIGKVSQARIDFCQRSSRYDRYLSGEHVNIFDMSLAAGTLMDLGVYCVYAAVDLFGPPQKIQACASCLPNGADSAGSALLTYANHLATLSYSKIGQSTVGSEIIGDQGSILIGSVSQYAGIWLVKDGNKQLLYAAPSHPEIMQGEASRFADSIEDFSRNEADYRQICILTENVHRCMDAIKASAHIHYPIQA